MSFLNQIPTMDRDSLRELKKGIDLSFKDFSRAYGDAIEGFFEPLLTFLIWLEKLLVITPWPIVIGVFGLLAWIGSRSIQLVIGTVASFSIIGLPPFGGSWSKFLLILGAFDTGYVSIIIVLMISSLLNVAYLLPIVGRGILAEPKDGSDLRSINEAPLLCWLPAAIAAGICLLLFFYAGLIQDFLLPFTEGLK